MSVKSNSRRNLRPLLAAAVALALPSLAFGQAMIDNGRANDASNRVGSFGRNGGNMGVNYYSNTVLNNGNQIVTGNVTQGRGFRGPVGYTDPYAFRGPTAGIVSDDFAKNSVGVPRAGAAPIVPNTSTTFYGAAQTVAPPPGFQLNASKTGYIPPATTTGQRGLQDQRMGVVDLNEAITPGPTPGNIMMRGSLNPQQAAEQLGVLTGSTLYGVREWNPQDPADRSFLQDLLNRQNASLNPALRDPRHLQQMRDELERAILPDRVDTQQQQQQPGGARRPQDSLSLDPLSRSFDSPANSVLANRPLNDQVEARALGTQGLSTEQGIRYNLLGKAHRTSRQYAELNKRLEQYHNERGKTDADFAREYNADVLKQQQAEKAKAAQAGKNAPVADANNPALRPDPNNRLKAPGTGKEADTGNKPKLRPQPVKVGSLATGVRGEGLSNVLKKAESLMKEGKYASALDQYDAAEAVTPNNPLIWLGRGNAELGAGFFVRADGHIRQALSTDPALLMGQYDLAGMLGEERLTRLVGELKEQATKDPTKPTPLFLLAYIAYNTGHEQQALGYLDLAEKRGGEPAFYKLLKDHWALPEAGGGESKPQQLNK